MATEIRMVYLLLFYTFKKLCITTFMCFNHNKPFLNKQLYISQCQEYKLDFTHLDLFLDISFFYNGAILVK